MRNINLHHLVQHQVKNRHETISTEEKLHVSRYEEGEVIIDICCNVRLAHNNVCTIHDNADRITESAKSGTTELVCIARLSKSYQNELYQSYGCKSYILIALEINKYTVQKCMYTV